jgi:hypothetical protein
VHDFQKKLDWEIPNVKEESGQQGLDVGRWPHRKYLELSSVPTLLLCFRWTLTAE